MPAVTGYTHAEWNERSRRPAATTTAPTRLGMPLYGSTLRRARPVPNYSTGLGCGGDRLSKLWVALDSLGIPADYLDAAREQDARARELWASARAPVSANTEAARRRVVAELARGGIDQAEASRQLEAIAEQVDNPDQARTLREAAESAYRSAFAEAARHGATLLDELRGALVAAIEALDADTYEAVHAVAADLRGWALDDATHAKPVQWRFHNPERLLAWQVETAHERMPRDRHGKIRIESIGTTTGDDGRRVELVRVDGVTPTLSDIRDHRDDWRPDLVTASELIENADRIADEQSGS